MRMFVSRVRNGAVVAICAALLLVCSAIAPRPALAVVSPHVCKWPGLISLDHFTSPWCKLDIRYKPTAPYPGPNDVLAYLNAGTLETKHHSAVLHRKELGHWADVTVPAGANVHPRDPAKGSVYVHSLMVWDPHGVKVCKPQRWIAPGGPGVFCILDITVRDAGAVNLLRMSVCLLGWSNVREDLMWMHDFTGPVVGEPEFYCPVGP